MARNICSVETCDRFVHSWGLCMKHRSRVERHGSTDRITYRSETGICEYEGCGRPHQAKGFCKSHAQQLRLKGEVKDFNPGGKIHGHATVHGVRQCTRTYKSWKSMKERCSNIRHKDYKNYGGRGIKFCSTWKDFANFLEDMGERPENTSIDRIDVDGNYEPENCRWATPKQQRNNQRKTKMSALEAIKKELAEAIAQRRRIDKQIKGLEQAAKALAPKAKTLKTRTVKVREAQ